MLVSRLSQPPWFLVLLACLALLGCGSGDDWVAPVEGTVTFDGKPLPQARVVFEPDDGQLPSEAMTNDKGYYKLHYSGAKSGAEVGTHVVRIRTSGMENGAKEIIPARYNANSELKATVESKSNTIDFDLKPGGEIVHIVEGAEEGEEQ